jgi:hypothetical protein
VLVPPLELRVTNYEEGLAFNPLTKRSVSLQVNERKGDSLTIRQKSAPVSAGPRVAVGTRHKTLLEGRIPLFRRSQLHIAGSARLPSCRSQRRPPRPDRLANACLLLVQGYRGAREDDINLREREV